MKKNYNSIEERLKQIHFRDLSASERDKVWQGITDEIGRQTDGYRVSPYFSFPLVANRKTMISLLIGALLFAGAGGTVVSADNARPGDTLFGVDRAVENVRLALAGKGKGELKMKFANERLAEVKSLIAESRSVSASSTATSTSATSTSTSTSPKKASRDNVALAVSTAIAYLNEISADLNASSTAATRAEIQAVIAQLENVVNADDVKFRLKQNGDFQLKIKGNVRASTTSTSTATSGAVRIKIDTSGNKDRIEVREDGEKIRIELKGGELFRVKTEVDSDDDTSESDDGRDRGRSR